MFSLFQKQRRCAREGMGQRTGVRLTDRTVKRIGHAERERGVRPSYAPQV